MRRIRLFLFSTALLASLLGVTAFMGLRMISAHTQAQTTQRNNPQVSCSGDGCDGLNPVSTGCATGAYTVQTAVFSNSYVELRYSPTCKTNWGRVTSKVGLAFLEIRVQRVDGLTYTFLGVNFNFAYSVMVYAPQLAARACGGVNGISGCSKYV